jgi:integrase
MGADNRWLVRQRQTWFAVVEVPPSLRSKLGRRIKRTLRTRDVAVARARRFKVVADIKAQIEVARKERQPDPLEAEALAWREGSEAIRRGERVIYPPAEDESDWGQEAFHQSLIGDRADALKREGKSEDQIAAFVGLAMGWTTPLDAYVEQWLSEMGAKGDLKERTKLERRRTITLLDNWLKQERLAGTIEAVTRKVAGRFVTEHLMPSGRHRSTIAKRIRTLSNYWTWLRRRGHVPEDGRNPWSEQAPTTRAEAEGERERAFTDDEMSKLFAEPPNSTLADFMAVAALSGMRREEVGRLTVADCQDGIFIVRGTKSAAALRRVPIHSGLAAIVKRRCQGDASGYLFDELRAGPMGERTDALGKLFTRFRRSLGIQDGDGRRSRVNFHSFRRWFNTAAINAGQSERLVRYLMGHADDTMTGRYWSGAEDAALRAVVEAVRLPAGVGSPRLRRDAPRASRGKAAEASHESRRHSDAHSVTDPV